MDVLSVCWYVFSRLVLSYEEQFGYRRDGLCELKEDLFR